jgi:hypothetical protein
MNMRACGHLQLVNVEIKRMPGHSYTTSFHSLNFEQPHSPRCCRMYICMRLAPRASQQRATSPRYRSAGTEASGIPSVGVVWYRKPVQKVRRGKRSIVCRRVAALHTISVIEARHPLWLFRFCDMCTHEFLREQECLCLVTISLLKIHHRKTPPRHSITGITTRYLSSGPSVLSVTTAVTVLCSVC